MPRRAESNVMKVASILDIEGLPTDTDSVLVAALDDQKIAALRRLNALRVLYHDGSSLITDVGLSRLVAFPTLEALGLEWSTEITDQGLKELQLIGGLRWLDLTGCTQLSERAVQDLRRTLPKCEIVW
jgi:hypothetical protein